MTFREYQHLERFGTAEVENIELGECYIFPKIDGTNASVWLGEDGKIKAGSRKRQLSIDDDNAGFCAWVQNQENLKQFFKEYPHVRLYGEWLVPHSLKTYRDNAWRNFYVFDLYVESVDGHKYDEYIPYDVYSVVLERFGISYIPPIAKESNGDYETFLKYLHNNKYLIEDGKGNGEGIVIKRYSFRNKYGRQTWAKMVTNEFKEKHVKEMGAPETQQKLVEEEIAKRFVTPALVDKEHAKIALDGWSSRNIPQLLNTVYYELIREEAWNFIKAHKQPTINFKRLQHFTFAQVKQLKPELF